MFNILLDTCMLDSGDRNLDFGLNRVQTPQHGESVVDR